MPKPRKQNFSRGKFQKRPQERYCYFCKENSEEINYKDIELLRKFTSTSVKILPRRRSGVCAKHQRKLALAIKRARIMALLPFVRE